MGMPEKENLVKCITDGWVSGGDFIADFESRMALACNRSYACATSSGTTALHLALKSLSIGPGDYVIVPTLTYVATMNAVIQCGAIPVFVDSRASDWQMDMEHVRFILAKQNISAVVSVHLYGAPCDMTELERIRVDGKHEVDIIEDAAQALGSGLDGRPVGSFGDISCFSFYGNKNITTGEGGMCLTDSKELEYRMNHLKNHATVYAEGENKYYHDTLGYNYRMSNLQAAVGCAQMKRLDEIMKRKGEICSLYTATIFRPIARKELKNGCVETWRLKGRGVKAGRWLYSLIVESESLRDGLMAHLKDNGIESRPFFGPCHLLGHVSDMTVYPVAEHLSKRGLNLPTYVQMTDEDVKFISGKVIEFLRHNVI